MVDEKGADAIAEEAIARQGAAYARASDLSWVATALLERRDAILNQSADQTHIPHAGDHVGFTWVSV